MNKTDVKNSFRKVLLDFETDRYYFNFITLLVLGLASLSGVVGFYVFNSNYLTLFFLMLPAGILWGSFDFYRKFRQASESLKSIHNTEIKDEIKEFTGKELQRNSKL